MGCASFNFIRGDQRGPIFAPRLGVFLGRLEQRPIQEILTDPISLCNALLRAQKLFQLDALSIEVNAAWIGHAGGWPLAWSSQGVQLSSKASVSMTSSPDELLQQGMMRTLLDALKALATALPQGVSIIGVIPGPRSLSQQLGIQDATAEVAQFEWCLELAMMLGRQYGELNALKAVLITERLENHPENQLQGLSRLCPLLNLLSFYQLSPLLSPIAHQGLSQSPSSIARLGFQGVILDDRFEPIRRPFQDFILGWAVAGDLLIRGGHRLKRKLQDILGQGISLLTTRGDVPADTDPSTLHVIGKLCKDFSTSEKAYRT